MRKGAGWKPGARGPKAWGSRARSLDAAPPRISGLAQLKQTL